MKDKAWSGRFEKATSRAMEDFHSSLRFDRRFYREDIAGSKAHAEMLASRGILTAKDAEEIKKGLEQVEAEIDGGSFIFSDEHEDIHMAVEKRLTDLIGEAGGRLHTARSRNDQVATDLRLYLRGVIDKQEGLIRELLRTFLDLADKTKKIILPGYTHLQPAQPIRLGFHFLAYFFMIQRDLERLRDLRRRVNRSPLGAGAFAGVNYDTDRQKTAASLGFDAVLENAMDAVSDRDFVAEYLAFASILMVHFSRLNEELVLWSSPAFGFVEIDDAYATGSSIMPNKKNPDASELIRGKTGRVLGSLVGMLTTLKGLPLAYNKDLQEDKEGLFDTIDTTNAVLGLLPRILETLTFREARMLEQCDKGFLPATDVADYLVGKGLPFREAHHVSGEIVKHLVSQNKNYRDLKIADFKKFSASFGEDIFPVLEMERIVENKKSRGSTSLASVEAQIALGRELLKK